MHISKYPERSWSVILQQAWTMRLRDRNSNSGGGSSRGNGAGSFGGLQQRNRNICYKYNRGRCTYGFNCKFDHKCAICGKWGHGAYNCRKGSGFEREKYFDRETGESGYRDREKHNRHDKHKQCNHRGKEHHKKIGLMMARRYNVLKFLLK